MKDVHVVCCGDPNFCDYEKSYRHDGHGKVTVCIDGLCENCGTRFHVEAAFCMEFKDEHKKPPRKCFLAAGGTESICTNWKQGGFCALDEADYNDCSHGMYD